MKTGEVDLELRGGFMFFQSSLALLIQYSIYTGVLNLTLEARLTTHAASTLMDIDSLRKQAYSSQLTVISESDW